MKDRIFYISIVSICAFCALGFSYLTIKEIRIWVLGERVEARIISIEKIDSDEFEILFSISNSTEQFSRKIERKAYNNLKNETVLKVIMFGKEKPEFVFLQLGSKNNVLKFLLGAILFGFISVKTFQQNL